MVKSSIVSCSLVGVNRSQVQPLRERALKIASTLLGLDEGGLPKKSAAPVQDRSWIVPLCLFWAAGLALVGLAQIASMISLAGAAYVVLWIGIILIVFPISLRLSSLSASRSERIVLVIMMGSAFYGMKIFHSPVRFTGYDEFLHWVTALNITERHRLLDENTLLPISPRYPGLEIVTNALSGVSGFSIFTAGLIVVGLGRVVLLGSLFLIAETVTKSARVAGLACAILMASSTFASFDAQYGYASLALVLSSLSLLAALRIADDHRDEVAYAIIGVLLAASITVTHHITAYFVTVILIGVAVLELAHGRRGKTQLCLVSLAAGALAANIAWWFFTGGTGSYIGPVVEGGASDFWSLISFKGLGRTPFASSNGDTKPLWETLTGLASTLLICLGLLAGFLRSLNLAGGRIFLSGFRLKVVWRNSGLVLLTLLTLGFPLSILLRLTPLGWEIGFRLISYIFFGVCIVVAVAIAGLWRSPRPVMIATILTIMVVGGYATGVGPNFFNYPYRVSADSQSIESLGVQAAEWTQNWLGRGQVFAADRINQVLLATYGRQIPLTGLKDRVRVTDLVFSKTLGHEELTALRRGWVDYVMIDLRLTTALPRYGVYFENGEDDAVHATPPEPAALLKFNNLRGVNRPFDNGALVIYDLRPLQVTRPATNIAPY